MNTTKILGSALLVMLAAACSADNKTDTSSGPQPGSKWTPTTQAVRVHGDLVPGRLVAVDIPKPTETALLHGSDPAAIRKPYTLETLPEAPISRDFHRNTANGASLTLPIDTPASARVLVRSLAGDSLTTLHMHSVATGQRLDRARDIETSVINVHHAVVPEAKLAKAGGLLHDSSQEPRTDMRATPIERESGFAQLSLPARTLSFDAPSTPGLVQIDVPDDVASRGLVIEVQQPSSHITFSGAPAELNYGFGETAELTFSVSQDTKGIDGATLSGWAELPNHARSPDITFTSLGQGKYMARIPLASASWDYIGVWGIHATATGTVNGVPFERDMETGFGFYPAHAQMTAISTPTVTRGADGLVDDVSFDIRVESLADDRFSVRGTLAFTGEDGKEHALATAQTGQVLSAGVGTMTLHFDAASMAVARVNGPFTLRDIALVSQGYVITQHRIGRGLELVTPPITAKEIRFPSVISLQTQDLIDNGDLPPVSMR